MVDGTEPKEQKSTEQQVSTEMPSSRDQIQQALDAERSSYSPSSSVAGITSSTSAQQQQQQLPAIATQPDQTTTGKHLCVLYKC